MSYVDSSIALFNEKARSVFIEYAASYQEKEELYLKGTHILRNRVLNGLVEMMMQQLKSEMEPILRECKANAPDEYAVVKAKMTLVYDHYVARFRGLNFDLSKAQE